jgi:hypothetical protein
MNRILKFEPWLFLLLVLFSAWPLLAFRYYPTLDGPAHQYNAVLIRHMLQGDAPLLSTFFQFNHEPMPNWTGHLCLIFLNFFLPSFLAEKIFLLACFAGLPFAFRYLLGALVPDRAWLSCLMLPFVHSFFFMAGFYNFNVAVIFLFLSAGYWVRLGSNPSLRQWICMALLLLLTYFSHILVFLVLALALGCHVLVDSLQESRKQQGSFFVVFCYKAWRLICISIPCFCFFVVYVIKHHISGEKMYLSKQALHAMLFTGRPLVTLNEVAELPNSTGIVCILFALLAFTLYKRFASLVSPKDSPPKKSHAFFKEGDSWLLFSATMLGLFYVFPDSDLQNGDGQSGYVSLRLCLLFYMALLTWLSIQKLPLKMFLAATLLCLFFHTRQVLFHVRETDRLSTIAAECHEASLLLESNKLVLPLNNSPDWIQAHFSNYLGLEKPVVILENYEAGRNFFPLRFRFGTMPATLLGATHDTLCDYWIHDPGPAFMKADYVFVLGNDEDATDTCSLRTHRKLKIEYERIYKEGSVYLYKLK